MQAVALHAAQPLLPCLRVSAAIVSEHSHDPILTTSQILCADFVNVGDKASVCTWSCKAPENCALVCLADVRAASQLQQRTVNYTLLLRCRLPKGWFVTCMMLS